MKKIEVNLQKKDDTVTVDFGGDFDDACCGKEARLFDEDLKALGVETKLQGIFCRLVPLERLAAKQQGQCIAVDRQGQEFGDIKPAFRQGADDKEAA